MLRNNNKFSLILIPLLLVFITLISSLILSSLSISADDIVDNISITVPISCTMTGTGMDTHTATINPGTYNSSIGTTTIKAFCNDNEGFAIYAIGYTNTKDGNNVLTDSNLTSASDIATSTATSGNNSAWAMKLTAPVSPTPTYPITIQSDTEGSFSSFHTVPDDYTLVAKRTSGTDIGTNAEGSTLTTTYQAYISQTQPAGTYTGKVKYTMVHPSSAVPNESKDCAPNKICYWPNAEGSVNDTMGDQSLNSSDTSTILWASNFQRPGYGFAGWSETYNYSDETKFHGPNETIEFTAGTYNTKGLSLYAIWLPSAGNLQGWTGCSNLNIGDTTALTDQRDNNTYTVAKLADGNCWMVENLRLDNTANHNTDGALAQGYGGVFAGLADPESANFNNSEPVIANSLYSGDSSTPITISGDNLRYRIPRYNNQNTSNPVTSMIHPGYNIYSYGNYYNYPATLANTNNYTSYTATIDGYTSETVQTSICPTGWRLPRGGNKAKITNTTPNDFYDLSLSIIGIPPANYDSSGTPSYSDTPEGENASKKIRTYPNNFIYTGRISGSNAGFQGGYGFYWSSTIYNNSSTACLFMIRSNGVFPATNGDGKYYGLSVRCMLDD